MVERTEPPLQLVRLRLSLSQSLLGTRLHREPRHRPLPRQRSRHACPEAGPRPAAHCAPHPPALLRHRGADERHQGGDRRQRA